MRAAARLCCFISLAMFAQAPVRGDGPADLAFAAGPQIRRLISGELTPDRAIATGAVEVLRGRRALLGRFASTFHLAA